MAPHYSHDENTTGWVMSGFQRLVLGSSVSLPSVFMQDVEIPTRAETSLKRNLDLCIDLLLCLFDRQMQFQFQCCNADRNVSWQQRNPATSTSAENKCTVLQIHFVGSKAPDL